MLQNDNFGGFLGQEGMVNRWELPKTPSDTPPPCEVGVLGKKNSGRSACQIENWETLPLVYKRTQFGNPPPPHL